VGLVQVAIWPTATDLGGHMTGSVAGWANFWGSLSGATGPVLIAFAVGMSDWASAVLVVSLAAPVGAALWLLVHPERPLAIPEVLGQAGAWASAPLSDSQPADVASIG
jgi:ACS family glucarate transporter-like MFS transporter